MAITAYRSDTLAPAALLSQLAGRNYHVGTAVPVTRTYLDTFDGLLHSAGVRLEFREGLHRQVWATGDATVEAVTAVSDRPQFARDLPAGPLRERLLAIAEPRALLALVELKASATLVTAQNESGRPIVEAVLYDDLRLSGRRGKTLPWVLEVRELPGESTVGAALHRQLIAAGLQVVDADALDSAFAMAGISRSGFDNTPTIPLDSDLRALDGYALVALHLSRAIGANWNGTIEDLDPEFLHDFRVAVRRTRSILSSAKHVFPSEGRARFHGEFKWLAQATGPARDLDVYVLGWADYVAPLGQDADALQPLYDEIQRRRMKAHTHLAATLRSQRARRLLPAWRVWLANPHGGQRPRDADTALGRVVAQRMTSAQAVVVERGRGIAADGHAEELHELRKDAKKLRYLLECFGGMLPAKPRKAFVSRLKGLQDNLGEHQDAQVHIAGIHELAQALSNVDATPETLITAGRLVEHLRQRRLASREEFAERFAAYDCKPVRHALRDLTDAIAP